MRATALRLLLVPLATLACLGSTAEAQRFHPGPPPWRRGGAPLPPGPGRLRNAAQGLCLDVEGWRARGNSNVLLWECNGDPDQVWSFAATGELTNSLDGRCLDAAGYDGQRGANVDVYRCEAQNDQRWVLVPRGEGTFELHNAKRGMCLDVNGRAGARGDNVLLWNCDGGTDQRWTWEPLGPLPPHVRHPRPMQDPPIDPAYTDPPPPSRVVVPPPPPPPPAPHAMGDGRFAALLQAIANEGFSSNKLAVIEQAAATEWFRVAQAKRIIEALSFSADKLRALELVAPHLVDPQNAFAIYGAFSFSSDKDQARQILQRAGH